MLSHGELADPVKQTYKLLLELDNELDKIKNRGTEFFKILMQMYEATPHAPFKI